MTTITHANGRMEHVTHPIDAMQILRAQYPDMESEDDGDRILVWACEAEARGNDASRTVAVVRIA